MTAFSLWYGLGVPDVDAGAIGAGVTLVGGQLRLSATDGTAVVYRQTEVTIASGDAVRISFGERFVDLHRNEAFVTRVWLPQAPRMWFAGRELRAVCP